MAREEVRIGIGGSGEECAAWLYRPSGEGPAPCVVMASGLTCVRDQGLDLFGRRFAEAGYAVLAFDYRNFGDSGGEPRQLVSPSGQRQDWRAAIAYARGLDGVDRDRVAIWGFSAGGGHVQALAMEEPGIAAAICVAPLVDGVRTLLYIGGARLLIRLGIAGVRDALRGLRGAAPFNVPATGPPGSPAPLSSPSAEPGFAAVTPPGSTWRNELCARTALKPPYRLAGKTGRIPCPILYSVTEQDDICPPTLSKQAAEAAPRGELKLYPGGHFDPFLGATHESVAADQVEFLRRHLPPLSQSRPATDTGATP